MQNPLVRRSDPKQSEVAPNPKTDLFLNEGQLQTIFRRIMHRGQKLELRLWISGLVSSVLLGRDWTGCEKCAADFLSLSVKKRTG